MRSSNDNEFNDISNQELVAENLRQSFEVDEAEVPELINLLLELDCVSNISITKVA